MTRRVVRRPAAIRDLLSIYVYLGQRSESAADRFLQSAESTMPLVAGMPGLGAPLGNDARFVGVRRIRITDFPNFLLIYEPTAEGIEVRRVIHAARDLWAALSEEAD